MQLVDTHCHIHEILGSDDSEHSVPSKWHKAGITDADAVITDAYEADVTRLVCVGCTVEDSTLAVNFVQARQGCWASIGIHPHEASRYVGDQKALDAFAALATQPKVVAIGECGLDFYYNHSSREDQERILRLQLALAQAHNLPLIFHVRDAFAEFWPIFDEYKGLRGVIHSFTATQKEADEAMSRGLYIGLNGIMTFTKDDRQLKVAKAIPGDKLVLETDAPFLTPTPYRGTICVSKHVRTTAAFLADVRGESLDDLATTTTQNAITLFGLT